MSDKPKGVFVQHKITFDENADPVYEGDLPMPKEMFEQHIEYLREQMDKARAKWFAEGHPNDDDDPSHVRQVYSYMSARLRRHGVRVVPLKLYAEKAK